MALERIDAGDFAGARRWLDWARIELRPSNSEDPLEGPAFARAWTVGAEADLAARARGRRDVVSRLRAWASARCRCCWRRVRRGSECRATS